jgi:hypothetical protein
MMGDFKIEFLWTSAMMTKHHLFPDSSQTDVFQIIGVYVRGDV